MQGRVIAVVPSFFALCALCTQGMYPFYFLIFFMAHRLSLLWADWHFLSIFFFTLAGQSIPSVNSGCTYSLALGIIANSDLVLTWSSHRQSFFPLCISQCPLSVIRQCVLCILVSSVSCPWDATHEYRIYRTSSFLNERSKSRQSTPSTKIEYPKWPCTYLHGSIRGSCRYYEERYAHPSFTETLVSLFWLIVTRIITLY